MPQSHKVLEVSHFKKWFIVKHALQYQFGGKLSYLAHVTISALAWYKYCTIVDATTASWKLESLIHCHMWMTIQTQTRSSCILKCIITGIPAEDSYWCADMWLPPEKCARVCVSVCVQWVCVFVREGEWCNKENLFLLSVVLQWMTNQHKVQNGMGGRGGGDDERRGDKRQNDKGWNRNSGGISADPNVLAQTMSHSESHSQVFDLCNSPCAVVVLSESANCNVCKIQLPSFIVKFTLVQ